MGVLMSDNASFVISGGYYPFFNEKGGGWVGRKWTKRVLLPYGSRDKTTEKNGRRSYIYRQKFTLIRKGHVIVIKRSDVMWLSRHHLNQKDWLSATFVQEQTWTVERYNATGSALWTGEYLDPFKGL
jgi:hypothetical protein